MHPIEQSRQAILNYLESQPPKGKVSSALETISGFAAAAGAGTMLKAFASNAFKRPVTSAHTDKANSSNNTFASDTFKSTYEEIAPVAETAIRQHPWPALCIAALAGAGLVLSKPAQRQAYRLAVGSLGSSLVISSLLPKILAKLQK